MTAYLNISPAEAAAMMCRGCAAGLLALPADRLTMPAAARDCANALLDLARAAEKGYPASALWPLVQRVNVAACGLFLPYAEEQRLLHVPMDGIRRALGLPGAWTSGVLRVCTTASEKIDAA